MVLLVFMFSEKSKVNLPEIPIISVNPGPDSAPAENPPATAETTPKKKVMTLSSPSLSLP